MRPMLVDWTPTQNQKATYLNRCRTDPVWWVRSHLKTRLWAGQRNILKSIRDNPVTVVRSGYTSSKTYTAACAALWFLNVYPNSTVVTTAPTDRQVRKLLWKEIRTLHSQSGCLPGECLTQELHLDSSWFAVGFTAPEYDPTKAQGFHARYTLLIIDEACGVSKAIMDSLEGVASGEFARILKIGNPTDINSQFARDFTTPGYAKFKISAFDTPNFTAFGITLEDIRNGKWEKKINAALPFPELVTPQWVARKHHPSQWGENSPHFVSKILGDFPETSEDRLIVLSWVELAKARELEPGKPHILGVDVGGGSAESVIYERKGRRVRMLRAFSHRSTMRTAGEVIRALKETGAEKVHVDSVGIGAGVVDRCREQRFRQVLGVNMGNEPKDKDRFVNMRAEVAWNVRQLFETGEIDIDPDNDILESQLLELKFQTNSKGQIQIESKDSMKRRGVPSPDRADALALCYARPRGGMLPGVAKL